MGAHTSAKEGANREPSTTGVIQAGNQFFRIVLDDVPVPVQGVRGPVERDIDVSSIGLVAFLSRSGRRDI